MAAFPPLREVTADEKRRVLERLLASRTFSRSDQLKRFLRYVCEKDIEGKASEINEYSIAIEALGRGPDYSPSDDSSVRTRAHVLRQKLQEYYETEESEPEIRIEVAKGAYAPQFLIARAPGAPDDGIDRKPAQPIRADKIASHGVKPFLIGAAVAALLLSSLAFLFRAAFFVNPRIDPVLREAWGTMLEPGAVIQVYIATPPAMLLHSYRDERIPAFLGLLRAPAEISPWYSSQQMMDGGGDLYMHTTRDVFLFGDSLAATAAVQLLSKAGAIAKPVPETNVRAYALRGSNVVIIGSPNYSRLAGRFLLNAPFSIRYDPTKRQEVVSDKSPEDVSAKVYRPSADERGMLTTAYGLLTVLPSETRVETGAKTVIFSGITSAGPQAALEYFRSPEELRDLKAKFAQQGYSTFPPAYQVVVRCGLDQNLALSWGYETHIVVNPSLSLVY